ncbi:ParB/RepB/Spo0J family partition protein [Streptosporangium sp. NPDC000396]|uniref:ParB/RepB/Spo0J family partition protein n=1 Tax=Streptosporangium sp. NPDC000396 TaxID=3366185 RepID=UPI003691EBB2
MQGSKDSLVTFLDKDLTKGSRGLSEHSTRIPLDVLLPADSPRSAGEDMAHLHALTEVEGTLPPITVHYPTMRVIDGMHRLRAARLRGDGTIDVRFFEGSERDAFVLAVRLNIAHGLPLSRADRAAAAVRIIESHPEWSDRMIASVSGMSRKAVAAIRGRSTGGGLHLNTRTGVDGRVRPLNAADGRRLAFQLMSEQPDASLREIAKRAGIAVATARDVQQRARRGQDPVPPKLRKADGDGASRLHEEAVGRGDEDLPTEVSLDGMISTLCKLKRDPSLRFSESGRTLLRLLDSMSVLSSEEGLRLASSVPPHCTERLAQAARACAQAWLYFAREVGERGRELA